ncbi:MAG TPA: alpha/beta hydrolase [Limnochordia bacterium]|nr:alpha/beta hydrolase [Limnochordia bacterium]
MTAVRELLFFRDLGENRDDRPALLLIHGDFSDGPGTWDRQMASEKLRAAFRMIVIDRRGAGASPSHPRPYTIRQEAEDALAVLDALKIPSFHVGGHSYGGLIACEVACLVPERVQSLHLIEPPYLSLLPDDPDVSALREATVNVRHHAAHWPAQQIAEAFFTALMGKEAVQRIKERPVWTGLVKEAERYAHQELPASYPPERLASFSQRLEKTVKGPPVIVYTGGRSHPALQKVAREIAARLEGAHLIFVPEAGHSVQQHASDIVEERLLACSRVTHRSPR